MIENSAKLGEYFREKLRTIPSPHIKEVRGKGLLVGVQLKLEAGGGRRYCEALQVRGVLAKTAHTHVIRLTSQLIVTKDDLDWALEIIEEVLRMP